MRRGYRDPLVYIQKAEQDVNAYLTQSHSHTSGISMFASSKSPSRYSSRRARVRSSRTLSDHVLNWRPSKNSNSGRRVKLKPMEQLKCLVDQNHREPTHKQQEVSVTPAQDPTGLLSQIQSQQHKVQPVACPQPLTVMINQQQSKAPLPPQPHILGNPEKEQKQSVEEKKTNVAENPSDPISKKPRAPWVDMSQDHGLEYKKVNGRWVVKSDHSPSPGESEKRDSPAGSFVEERSFSSWQSGGSSRDWGRRREFTPRDRDFSRSGRSRRSRSPRNSWAGSLDSRWSRRTLPRRTSGNKTPTGRTPRDRTPRRRNQRGKTSRDRSPGDRSLKDRSPQDRTPRWNKRGGKAKGKGRAANIQPPQFSDNGSMSPRPYKKGGGKKNKGGGKKKKGGGKKKKGGKKNGKKSEGADTDKVPLPAPLPDSVPGKAPLPGGVPMPAPLPGEVPLPGQAPVPVPGNVPTPKKKPRGPARSSENVDDGFGEPSDEEKKDVQRKCCGAF